MAHQGHNPMLGSPRRAGYAQELTHWGWWHQRQAPSVASLLCNWPSRTTSSEGDVCELGFSFVDVGTPWSWPPTHLPLLTSPGAVLLFYMMLLRLESITQEEHPVEVCDCVNRGGFSYKWQKLNSSWLELLFKNEFYCLVELKSTEVNLGSITSEDAFWTWNWG